MTCRSCKGTAFRVRIIQKVQHWVCADCGFCATCGVRAPVPLPFPDERD